MSDLRDLCIETMARGIAEAHGARHFWNLYTDEAKADWYREAEEALDRALSVLSEHADEWPKFTQSSYLVYPERVHRQGMRDLLAVLGDTDEQETR